MQVFISDTLKENGIRNGSLYFYGAKRDSYY